MPETISYKKIYSWAEQYNDNLLCSDSRFRNYVHVHSKSDTTSLFYNAAFVITKYDFDVVFTEHNGFHVFCTEDYCVRQYKLMKNYKE